jgi:chromosome segregation ATPase
MSQKDKELEKVKAELAGKSPEELAELLLSAKAAQASSEEQLKTVQKEKEDAENTAKELQQKLADASAPNVEAAAKQAALQQKYFKKTWPAKVPGKITVITSPEKLDEKGEVVKEAETREVEILHGIASVYENPSIHECTVAKIDTGKTDEKGNPVYEIVKDDEGKVSLPILMKYKDKVPALQQFLQDLYDGGCNIFADEKGNAIFGKQNPNRGAIVKL